MAAISSAQAPATTILLFGPQVHTFDEASFSQLRSTLLEEPGYTWLLDVISELPQYWESISNSIPKLQIINGSSQLTQLGSWMRTASFTKESFPLPNILLTPLVVITQLAQYAKYLEVVRPEGTDRQDLCGSFKQDVETLGFCTGLLTGLAVSSASNESEFKHYGAVAVRLAMLIGALVDVQDGSTNPHGESKSFSATWNSSESHQELLRILEEFPEAYISVLYDERRITITTSRSTASSLLQQLKAAGVIVSEFGLLGRFHCPCYDGDMESLYRFCNSQPAFQFPDASALVLPTRSNSGGSCVDEARLHNFALRSILVEQSNWYQSFTAVWSARLADHESMVVSFGLDRCVPLTYMRKLGSRLIQAADLDNLAFRLPGRVLEPMKYKKNPLDDQIAVIGMACKVAGADNLEEFWDLLCKGQSQHVEVPAERFGFETTWRENVKKKWYGNFVRDHDAFDHRFFKKSPREMASTDPQQRLMLQVAYQAVEQSGYFQSQKDKHIGCYIGMGNVEYEQNVGCYPANAFSATGNLKAFTAGKISHFFGWTGPGLTIDTACSASAVSIHHACKAILSGDCTAALAGGVAIYTNPGWYQNLAGAAFLSPTGPCKPFDSKADGYCRGEGIGAVFLKKMSTALADGDQILGVIASTAVYQNQNCTPITVPNAISLSGLFENVTRQAGLTPEQISVVEAHGTGTPVGDPAEFESVRRVFGGPNRTNTLSLGSVKGLVGHTECASGVIALIKTLLMIQEGAIPPQASFETLNPSIKTTPADRIEIVKSLRPWEVSFRAALINNYGASGSNASMVVTQISKSSLERDPIKDLSGVRLPFWFCGFDDQNLRVYSARLRQFIRSNVLSRKNLSLANLSFNVSRQSNRSLNRALVFNCNSVSDLEQKLIAFENGDTSVASVASQAPRPVILCFGGQVSTFVGLDRQIYDNVSVLRYHLDECNTACKSIGLDGIYPELFQKTAVEDVVKLQTVLFAMQYSCARSWIDCGTQVASVVGHSFGELTALCVSGVLSLRDSLKLIAGRARVIQNLWGDEKGSMIAVEGNLEDVEKLLAESISVDGERAATIACYNGPRSFTLAGSTKAIDQVEKTVANSTLLSSIKAKRLNVTNAFHSTLVDHLTDDLEKVAEGVVFRNPTIPIERATETGSATLTTKFIAEHMRNPVYFNHAVQRLSSKYPNAIWLEAGSSSTITNMASRALGSPKDSHFQPMNITSSGENSLQYLTDATTNLWREGLNISFWPHHSMQTSEYAPLLLPPYQFEKSRHWLELKKPQLTIDAPTPPVTVLEELPTELWTFIGYQDAKQRSARFRINTMIKKFEKFISGHKMVQTAPLCPSTLQLDIVIEALMSLRADLTAPGSNLQPQLQGLENHAPLCLDPSRLVWLDVESKDSDAHDWEWKFVSNTAQDKSATTLHASGKVVFRSTDDEQLQSEFTRYERIVGHKRCLQLLDGNDADDIMQGRNVYKAFAEIVDYGEIYRGVQKVVGKGTESAGRIVKKYSAESWLDTPLADCFAQVAGIFVNCMTDRGSQDVFISNKIDRWIRSPKLRTGDSRPEVWDLFVYHDRQSDKEYLSDVFVFDSRNGSLVEMILGLKFHKVSKAGLSKVLSRLNPGGTKSQPVAPSTVAQIDIPRAAVKPLAVDTSMSPRAITPKKKKPLRPDISESLRSLLANISGLEPGEIENDTGLADIGIDSLMGMELAREIETAYKVSLDTAQLNEVVDFQDLLKCIEASLGPVEDDMGSESDGIPSEIEDTESQGNDTPLEPLTPTSPKARGGVSEFLAEQLGIPESDVELEAHLSDLGVDSLLSTELISDISARFGYKLSNDIVFEELTVKELEVMINGANSRAPDTSKNSSFSETIKSSAANSVSIPSTKQRDLEMPTQTVIEAFEESKRATDQFISEYKLADYANVIWPKQTELTIAYIVEAFEKLGCSLVASKPGQELERIKYLPKHERFVEQIYTILEKEGRLIDIDGTRIIRTAIAPPNKTSEVLFDEIIRSYPDYVIDNKLMKLTGSKLAECLSGQSDGIQLIFGNAESRNLVSSWYCQSPINRAFLKQMEGFIKGLISRLPMNGPIKILEMGAGTGGTTAGMAPLLASLNVEVEYTFTDLSPSLVAAAKRRFKEYSFMKFMIHDIEKPAPAELLHSQHIVIANNCVHATHDLAISTKSIHSVLRPDGFLTMLEMTATPSWIDLIFGLLEGWWLFDDGRKHALTPQLQWQKVMQSVGYGQVDWTEGSRPEASVQRILMALASGPRYARLPMSRPPKSHIATDCENRQALIDGYIRKYTQDFRGPVSSSDVRPEISSDHCVLITGATGSLGSHLVANFADMDTVRTVVCLNRRNGTDPLARQRNVIESRGIPLGAKALSKLKVFETDTTKPMLGLKCDEYEELVSTVTHIVHNAWPMSIKRPVKGFESQFQAMQNLIDLSYKISCIRPSEFKVGFQFISSIATVGYYPLWSGGGTARVPEERMTVESILPVGYGDAKYVCERMLDETLHKYPGSFRPMAVRLGQIAGSQTSGYWNPMEHISFLVKSSQTLKALPQLEGNLSWCPANSIAATLGDLLVTDTTPYPIYHIENPARQSWAEMMGILADALHIPKSNIIPFDEWVNRVRHFPGSAEDNPASKLIDFFAGDFIRMSCGELILDTTKTQEHSTTLASLGPVSAELAAKYVGTWQEMGFLN